MFSQKFPSFHPKAGQPTYFVEKIWKYLSDHPDEHDLAQEGYHDEVILIGEPSSDQIDRLAKHHTIRSGHRWKQNDIFSPRVWSGSPYRSKQVLIWNDLILKKVWDILILPPGDVFINGRQYGFYGSPEMEKLAFHDGLTVQDFQDWFANLPFDGQILCWDAELEY